MRIIANMEDPIGRVLKRTEVMGSWFGNVYFRS